MSELPGKGYKRVLLEECRLPVSDALCHTPPALGIARPPPHPHPLNVHSTLVLEGLDLIGLEIFGDCGSPVWLD